MRIQCPIFGILELSNSNFSKGNMYFAFVHLVSNIGIIFSKNNWTCRIPMRVRKPSSGKRCFFSHSILLLPGAREENIHSIPLQSINHQPQLLLLYHNETHGVGRDESMSSSGGWCRYKVRPRGSRPPEEEETIQGRSTTVRRRGGSDPFSAELFPDERRQLYDSHWTATTRTTT